MAMDVFTDYNLDIFGEAASGATIVRKSADQTVNNSITLVDDDELLFAVGANEVWDVWLFLRLISDSTPDLKFAFTVPPSGTIIILVAYASLQPQTDGTTAVVLSTSGAAQQYLLHCQYVGGATAGNVQFQWAQNTADASDTKVLANSSIIAHKLA